MKLVIATTALICCSDIISAFTLPSSSTFVGRGATTPFGTKASTRTALFAGPEEEEGDGLDLNLEEMFDMYVVSINFVSIDWESDW